MNRTVVLIGLSACVSSLTGPAALAGMAQPLPTPFPETRYQQMSARSPFAVATAAAATAQAATPDFAAQLYVDGIAHVGQADFVAIKSRDPDMPNAILVEVGKSTKDGMKVEGVNWSSQTGKSTVEITKGAEKATLQFDEAQVQKVAVLEPVPIFPSRPLRHQPRPSPDFVTQNGELVRVPVTQNDDMPGPPDRVRLPQRLPFQRSQ